MSARTAEEARFEAAALVGEMIALVERLLAGQATRDELLTWAHGLFEERGRRPFGANAAAHALHLCLWNLDEHAADRPLVRDVDLAERLRVLRDGEPRFERAELAALTLPLAEVARRVGRPVTRFGEHGQGWFEQVRFASLATGRAFLASCPLRQAEAATSVRTEEPHGAAEAEEAAVAARGAAAEALADLFDTLGIDLAECAHTRVAPVRRWRLMRADDNGNQAIVAELSGYAKARREAEAYTRKGHKQTYWLEPSDA